MTASDVTDRKVLQEFAQLFDEQMKHCEETKSAL